MSETDQNDTQTLYVPMAMKRLVQVALFGVLAGLIVWGLTYVLETYVLKSLLCPNQGAVCARAAQYGEVAATIAGGAIGLFALVRLQVFRPLLVVIATVASLWGLMGAVHSLPWYFIALSMSALYMSAYLLFTWITRLRLFVMVVIILVILIVAIRLILAA